MIVVSLWDVGSERSFELLVRFAEHLAAGIPVARALRDTTTDARKAGLPPFDWAPFILVGHHGFRD
jgi:CHAT domain-containing protein